MIEVESIYCTNENKLQFPLNNTFTCTFDFFDIESLMITYSEEDAKDAGNQCGRFLSNKFMFALFENTYENIFSIYFDVVLRSLLISISNNHYSSFLLKYILLKIILYLSLFL